MQVISAEKITNDNYVAVKGLVQVGQFIIPFSVTHPRGEKNTQYVNMGRRVKNGDRTEDSVSSALEGTARYKMSDTIKSQINTPAPKNELPSRPNEILVLEYKETPDNKVVQGEGKVKIDDLIFSFSLKGKMEGKPGWVTLGGTQKVNETWTDVVQIVSRGFASELYQLIKDQTDKMVSAKPASGKSKKSW